MEMILSALAVKDMSAINIIQMFELNQSCASRYLLKLMEDGKVHISSWRKTRNDQQEIAFYSYGPGVNAIRTPQSRRIAIEPQDRVGEKRIAMMTSLLKATPLSKKELSQLMEISQELTTYYLKKIKAKGDIHICDWRKEIDSISMPIYSFGSGEDAIKPVPKIISSAERKVSSILARGEIPNTKDYLEAFFRQKNPNASPIRQKNIRSKLH